MGIHLVYQHITDIPRFVSGQTKCHEDAEKLHGGNTHHRCLPHNVWLFLLLLGRLGIRDQRWTERHTNVAGKCEILLHCITSRQEIYHWYFRVCHTVFYGTRSSFSRSKFTLCPFTSHGTCSRRGKREALARGNKAIRNARSSAENLWIHACVRWKWY